MKIYRTDRVRFRQPQCHSMLARPESCPVPRGHEPARPFRWPTRWDGSSGSPSTMMRWMRAVFAIKRMPANACQTSSVPTSATAGRISAITTRSTRWAMCGLVGPCSCRAHVKDWNENNLGIMLMGNFMHERPTPQALAALARLVSSESARYRVPSSMIRTHRELSPTACPGDHLQREIHAARSRRLAGFV